MTASPPLAVTLGDAAGVGPELVLTAGRTLAVESPLVAYGSVPVLAAGLADLVGRYPPQARFETVVAVDAPGDVTELAPGMLGVIEPRIGTPLPALEPYPWGQAIPAFGALQHASLLAAVDHAMAGAVSAILTAPWHKARLHDVGLRPTGHTEVLRDRAGVDHVVMMLAGDVLRVALATIHVPVSRVAELLTADEIVATARIVDRGLREQWGITAPTIAVCGLNPHAGEEGTIGTEETEVIVPALARLRADGVDVTGPHPADTLFPRVVAGMERADAVIAMYHDQGLVPLKTVHFGASMNVTLGLPFVRTSVDHGTAYDIAGRGVVDPSSFLIAGRHALASARARSGRA